MGAPWAGLLFIALLALAGCGREPNAETGNPIREAAATLLDGALYGHASLNPAFLAEILAALQQGEQVLGVYRFRFLQTRSLFPDRTLADITLRRRLKLHLITERFELEDPDREQSFFTEDGEDALAFFGRPRLILLGPPGAESSGPASDWILPEKRYHLEVRFRLEREGVSHLFRILNRLFTFWEPVDHFQTVDYRPP